MSTIDDVTRELLEHSEFVALVTNGPDGPHLVGNWGDYLRRMGIDADHIVLPAGRYQKTEENLLRDNRVQLMVASRAVRGTHGPGQGCVIRGTAAVQTEGEYADRARAAFRWARGALVVTVENSETQL